MTTENSHWKDYGKPMPGSKIDPTTLQDIIASDAQPHRTPLHDIGSYDPPPRLIPFDRYLDPAYVDLEVEHIWKKEWQIACREEDIPNVGDRLTYDIVDNSYIIVRSKANEFRAFHNSCRHRGRQMCSGKENAENFRCPFHGWVYDLEGRLEWVPFEQEFPHVDAEHNSLVPVQLATWGGNIFINPDPNAEPLEKSLGVLVDHFKDYPIDERYTAMRILLHVNCNWKAAQEAFMEGYHVVETHADGMPMFGSAMTQVDIWEQGHGYISRLCTPGMTTDSYLSDKVTPHEGLVLYCSAYDLPLPPEDRGNTPEDARLYAAEQQRIRLEANTGKDWSSQPVSYFLDMAKYFMYPNHHPWWGEGLPWWYKFTPYGRDPDKSVMEYRMLLPIPKDGKRPEVPEAIIINFGEKAEDNPALGTTGHIVDQDMSNMNAVQRGFKAAATGAAYMTLSHYQEAKIRRFHEIYDQRLGLKVND